MEGYSFFLFMCFFWQTFVEGSNYRFDYTYNQAAGGWLKYHRVPATFNSAFVRCHAEGAVVASPLNEALLQAMEKLRIRNDGSCGVFTGIHAVFSKQDFASVEGVPLSKIPVTWAPDEPDNRNDSEDCTIMLRNGTLADVLCKERFPYICFRKKTSNPVLTVCGTVDKGYELNTQTGSCYKFHHVGLTWRRAYMTCMAEGAHLAIINSHTEAQALKELFARYPVNKLDASFTHTVLIGNYDMGERRWFTIHGQSLEEAGYSVFHSGQPDYASSIRCGGMYRSGEVDDFWCENALIPFICEKKPDSLIVDEDGQ